MTHEVKYSFPPGLCVHRRRAADSARRRLRRVLLRCRTLRRVRLSQGREGSQFTSKIDKRPAGKMPSNFNPTGDFEAFPFAGINADPRPRGRDGLLANQAWPVGTTAERTAVLADVQIYRRIRWISQVPHAHSARRCGYPFERCMIDKDWRIHHHQAEVTLDFTLIQVGTHNLLHRYEATQIDGEATVSLFVRVRYPNPAEPAGETSVPWCRQDYLYSLPAVFVTGDQSTRIVCKNLRIYLGLLHFQFRISGISWPCLSMYCLCSMSLSRTICFR